MNKEVFFLLIIGIIGLSSCLNNKTESIEYPTASKEATIQTVHGHVLNDDYYWLRNKDSIRVKNYLKQENDYLTNFMKNTDSVQANIYKEIVALTNENYKTLPYIRNQFWYKGAIEKGQDYPVYSRWPDSNPEQVEVYFDENKWVEYFDAYSVSPESISKDNKKLLFSVDMTGSGELDMYVLDIKNQRVLPDKMTRAYSATWANDNETIFYVKDDSITNRSYQLYKHKVGEKEEEDTLLFHEKDDNYSLSIQRSTDFEYVFLSSSSKDENEYWYLNANNSNGNFKLFSKRQKGVEYELYSSKGFFYVLTNENAINNKLCMVSVSNTNKKEWNEVIPHNKGIIITDVDIFKDYLVVSEKKNGLPQIHVFDKLKEEDYYLPVEGHSYELWTSANFDFDTDRIRYKYESLSTPEITYEWSFISKEKKELKNDAVENYKKDDYQVERIWAKSYDGTLIPISLIYNKTKFRKDGTKPLLIEGYGAYGISMKLYYNKYIFPLLDKGFIYAIPHVRGGGYLGTAWYRDGKLLNKKNTFKDFIACTEHLIAKNYCDEKQVIARGGSAGGLLMGAIANIKPNLYSLIIAEVPFLDVINTMMDESIPLTTSEYTEWGNPNNKEYFEYMLSYSPYDNVQAMEYPSMLFVTGIEDENVPYWEAAKMVAKLREISKNPQDIFLKTNMGSGHQGASGRYPAIEEEAYLQTFILKQMLTKNKPN